MSAVVATRGRSALGDTAAAARVEAAVLIALLRVRIALALCVLGPLAFGVLVRATGTLPADTVFGRQVLDSAAAVPLVVLGFAGSWAVPLLVAVVAGDVVGREDHHGTWPTVLTRACSRRALLGGKIVAATAYVLVALVLLTASSVVAGLVVTAHRPLIGLSGTRFGTGEATVRVLGAWASVVPAALAFGAIALLVSVVTRSSLAAIVVPTAFGLLGQLLTLVDGGQGVVAALPTGAFLAWHGLFASPAWTGPLWRGVAVGAVWTLLAAGGAVVAFDRRLRRGL